MKTLEVKLMQPRDDTKSRCTTETRVKDDGCTCTLSDSAAGNTENKKCNGSTIIIPLCRSNKQM